MVPEASHKVQGVEAFGENLVKKHQRIGEVTFQRVVYEFEVIVVVQNIEVLYY